MKNLKKLIYIVIFIAVAFFASTVSSKAATTVTVTGDTLNMRKGPSTETKVVAMLFKGVECEVLDEEEDWYKVQYKTYTGYVSKEYVKVVKSDDENVNNNNTDNALDNSKNEIIENNTVNGNNINTNNSVNEELTNNTVETNVNNNSTQDETAAIYKNVIKSVDLKLLPLIYSSNIEEIEKNSTVLVIGNVNGWSYVQVEDICGWIRNEYLDEANTSEESNKKQETNETKTAYISESSVNMRKGAGTNYNIIKVLSLNTQVTIIDEDDGWYKIKVDNTTGYVSKEYVSDTKTTTTRSNSVSRIENAAKLSNSVEADSVVADEKKIETEKSTSNSSENKTNTTTVNETITNNVSNTKIKGTDIIAYAKKFLGYKYVYGGDGSNGTFDCSGFTMYVYKHFGINIPHGANSQYKCGKGTKITNYNDLQVGDIVMLTDYETGEGIGHCGIYLGNDNFIHASTTCNAVEISSFKTIYNGRFYAGLRLI